MIHDHELPTGPPTELPMGLPAVLVTGAPATGKTTVARDLAARLGAALIDQDVATGPLVDVVQELSGLTDLDDPRLAELTRVARYEVVTALAVDNLTAGVPVVLVAPFTAERDDPQAWATLRTRLTEAGGQPLLVWLELAPETVLERLRQRNAHRDAAKLADPDALVVRLAALARTPSVPHLRLDADRPVDESATRIVEALRPPGPWRSAATSRATTRA